MARHGQVAHLVGVFVSNAQRGLYIRLRSDDPETRLRLQLFLVAWHRWSRVPVSRTVWS